MFCTTIIPTIGRPTLSRAVQSVLDQALDPHDWEIIVVNDSGSPLPAANWQHCEQVTLLDTFRHERSVARNTGAAVAKGRFLHFLDDDDWMLPGAMDGLRQLAHSTSAVLLYGSSQLVDRNNTPVIQLHHQLAGNCFIQVVAGEWIPLQSSLIRSDTFFQVGGFNARLAGPEDTDLLRKLALQGDFAGTSQAVACITMGTEGSTTDHSRSRVESRRAREQVLTAPGAFTRMRQSAISDYWLGRVTRAYLTSAVWNLQHRRGFTASSRMVYSLASLILSGSRLFSSNYWRAVTRSYESETFLRGFECSAPQSSLQ